METVVLRVEGMSCTGCGQRIGTVLRRIDGVREVTADHVSGRVEIRIGPEVAEMLRGKAIEIADGHEVGR